MTYFCLPCSSLCQKKSHLAQKHVTPPLYVATQSLLPFFYGITVNKYLSFDAPTFIIPSAFAGALGKALCFINREKQTCLQEKNPLPHCRIMVISASTPPAHQYNAFMDALFAARKHLIPVDVLVLGILHSVCRITSCLSNQRAFIFFVPKLLSISICEGSYLLLMK